MKVKQNRPATRKPVEKLPKTTNKRVVVKKKR